MRVERGVPAGRPPVRRLYARQGEPFTLTRESYEEWLARSRRG